MYNIVRTLFLLVHAPIDDQYRDQLQRLVSKTVHSPLPQLLSCGQIANYFPGPLSPCLSLAINTLSLASSLELVSRRKYTEYTKADVIQLDNSPDDLGLYDPWLATGNVESIKASTTDR